MSETPQVHEGNGDLALPDLESVFMSDEIDRAELNLARRQIFQHEELRQQLKHLVSALSAAAEGADKPASRRHFQNKLGYAQWILNDFPAAADSFKAAGDTDGEFLLGLMHLEQENPAQALPHLEKAAGKDDSVEVACALLEARTKLGEAEDSLKAAEKLANSNGDSAEPLYQKGLALDFLGEYEGAIRAYTEALDKDEKHARANFRLGYVLCLRGRENDALAYYQRCLDCGPAHASILNNIGLLYEDRREFEKAVRCYEKILKGDPTNERARLYLKDALASQTMHYDENQQDQFEKRSDMLGLPISDFELSVRCRSALESIGILNIGDLVLRTEVELLSCKNFGETSLHEIKILLAQNNLHLGMSQSEIFGSPRAANDEGEDSDQLDRLVAELDLSVRSRRCMERLGIVTLRDLTDKSEKELLSGKNFGRTSLKEIKDKLNQLEMKLADDS